MARSSFSSIFQPAADDPLTTSPDGVQEAEFTFPEAPSPALRFLNLGRRLLGLKSSAQDFDLTPINELSEPSFPPVASKVKTKKMSYPISEKLSQAAKAQAEAEVLSRAQQSRPSSEEHHGVINLSLKYKSLDIPFVWQNSCGQYAIATVLTNLGKPCDYNQLCYQMNPNGQLTTAKQIADYLDPQIGAECLNRGTIVEIKQHIDSGRPAILTVMRIDGEAHSIVVSGYRTDHIGTITSWEVQDSAWGAKQKDRRTFFANADLVARWQKPFGESCPQHSTQFSCHWIKAGTKI